MAALTAALGPLGQLHGLAPPRRGQLPTWRSWEPGWRGFLAPDTPPSTAQSSGCLPAGRLISAIRYWGADFKVKLKCRPGALQLGCARLGGRGGEPLLSSHGTEPDVMGGTVWGFAEPPMKPMGPTAVLPPGVGETTAMCPAERGPPRDRRPPGTVSPHASL